MLVSTGWYCKSFETSQPKRLQSVIPNFRKSAYKALPTCDTLCEFINVRSIEVLNDHDSLVIDEQQVVSLFQVLDNWSVAAIPMGALSIAFLNPRESGEVHAQFFNDPAPTDVMTFPGDPDEDHAGDIAVCPDIALAATVDYGTTFEAELTLYLVHGWLHLAGFNDRTTAQKEKMRAMEKQAMAYLQSKNALPNFSGLTPTHP